MDFLQLEISWAGLIDVLGYLTLGVCALYGLLLIIGFVLKIRRRSSVPRITMPVLVPLAIPTRSQPSPLHKLVAFVTSTRHWRLAENWHYTLDNGVTIIIPKGFRFDGASIPRLFWMILSPVGLLLIPGLIHDYGYRYGLLWRLDDDGCLVEYQRGAGKKYWDLLFKEVGDRVNNVLMVNILATTALFLGGQCSWKKHRARNKIPARPRL